METRLSSKGQVVVPAQLRRQLQLRAGDRLEVRAEDGGIVLTPRRKRRWKGRVITDPVTGWPVLSFGPNAPKISCEDVKRMLEEIP